MREWALAILYATLASAALLWIDPPDDYWVAFGRHMAVLTPPLRWAIHLEARSGCWLHRIWS